MTASFDARADSYAEAAVVQRALAAWLAEWLEPVAATRSLRAVDLGAGDGLLTERLVDRFAEVRAIDSAPRMVQRGAARLPTVQWQQGDAWGWTPECEQSPQRIFSASLLQWCPDPLGVLRRWRQSAAAGVRMLHGFYAAPTLEEWQTLQPGPPPLPWRTPAEWLHAFRAAGWDVVRSESVVRTFCFPTAIDVLRFFHRTGTAVTARTAPGRMRAMLRELDRRHAARNGAGVPTEWTFFRIETQCDRSAAERRNGPGSGE